MFEAIVTILIISLAGLMVAVTIKELSTSNESEDI